LRARWWKYRSLGGSSFDSIWPSPSTVHVN
jgi:hypothetical protein